MFSGVIFDMDGLMFDTEKVWGACWEPTLARLGLPMKEGIADAARGTAGPEFAHVVREWFGEKADAQLIWDVWHEVAAECFEHGIEKKPGLDELLAYLDEQGVPMAVASSSPRRDIIHHLDTAEIRSYFTVGLSSLEVEHAKPAPDVFLEAARRIDVEPSQALVLEDSYNGVRAGVAGGFCTVMVPDLAAPSEEMRRIAHRICSSLLEVRDLLRTGELG